MNFCRATMAAWKSCLSMLRCASSRRSLSGLSSVWDLGGMVALDVDGGLVGFEVDWDGMRHVERRVGGPARTRRESSASANTIPSGSERGRFMFRWFSYLFR